MAFAGSVQAGFTVPFGTTASLTTNSGGPTVATFTAGAYTTMDAFLTALQLSLTAYRPVTAGAWAVSCSNTGSSATGKITISVTAGTFSITWIDTDLRDLLGFDANISGQTSATGALHCRGLWLPDSPIAPDLNYQSAPPITDARQARTPSGKVFTHVGNVRYEQSVTWTACPKNRVWFTEQSVVNESLEQFLIDAQWNIDTASTDSHPWFTAGSKCLITGHDGSTIGSGIHGWYLEECASMKQIATRVTQGWDGLFSVKCLLSSDV